jgi:ribosome production factor 2
MEDKTFLKIKSAKTQKGKNYLKNLLPKLIEDPKQCLFINTQNTSEIMRMILNDLYLTRKNYSIKKKLTPLKQKEKEKELEKNKNFNKKNLITNIEESKENILYLTNKNNCNFFTFTHDNKRNPMTITFGLLFNHDFLDVFEFEVTNFIPIEYFKKNNEIEINFMKPIVIFQGEIFESDFNYERLKNFFFDYFKLFDVNNCVINELKKIVVISCDSKEKIVKIRNYEIKGEISEQNLKNFNNNFNNNNNNNNLNNNNNNFLNLIEIGPSIDLKEKKFILADDGVYKNSLKQPKQLKENKEKNIEKNKILGIKRGRLHIDKQNLNAVSLKKYKKILGKKRFGKKGENINNNENNDNKENKNIEIEEK